MTKGKELMIKKYCAGFCLFLCVFILSLCAFKQAHANLMILPTNIVFEGRDRYAVVTLINNGSTTARYNLEWTYHKMLPETGAYEHLEDLGDEFDLSKHLVLSPRRVSLAPKAKQKIRLALRRPADIAPGDYRAHLRFTAVPTKNEDSDSKINVVAEDKEGAEASVKFVVSYSIPVFWRVGESDVKAELGQISLERNANTGMLDLLVPTERSAESPYSILGYVMVYHIDEKGEEEFIGELSNANIFPEINNRTFRVLLTKDIEGGSLRVVLKERAKDGDVYTQKIYSLE